MENIANEYTDDGHADPILRIVKRRGKLTLGEVQQQCNKAADYYSVQFFCCVFCANDGFDDSEDGLGDSVELYPVDASLVIDGMTRIIGN